MSEDEIKLWEKLLVRFNYGMGYLDYDKMIVRNSILYTLQSKGLTIDSKEGDNEEILEKFAKASRNISEPFKISLKDKNGVSAELIYYFPQAVTGEGKIFLSEPGNKSLTEFTQFEGIDKKLPPIKRRDGTGKLRDYYTQNFGTKITTIISKGEGLFVNELKISHVSKDIEYPKVSIGEVESSIRFYGDFYSDVDPEDFDFSRPMIEIKDNTPGVVGTKKISVINGIIRGFKKERKEPTKRESYPFTDLTGDYTIPPYDSTEKFSRDFSYIKSAIYANKDLLRDYIKKYSKEEPVAVQKEEPIPEIVQKEELPEVKKEELPKPTILSPEVENKLFTLLANRIKRSWGPSYVGKDTKVLLETILGILKLEELHFKMVDGVPLTKAIEECNIGVGGNGLELIDQNGRSYRFFCGGSSKIMTIIGEDKIINIKTIFYPDEELTHSDYKTKIAVGGYGITTIGIENGGIYKNENVICLSKEYSDKNDRARFFPKNSKTEYYSKDLLLALGINLEEFMKSTVETIRFHGEEDIFKELHKYGEGLAETDDSRLAYDRSEFARGRI